MTSTEQGYRLLRRDAASIQSAVGEPSTAHLEDVLVPTYLMHRYHRSNVAATISGEQRFSYAMRGDGQRLLGKYSVTADCPADRARQHAGYPLARDTDVANRAGLVDPAEAAAIRLIAANLFPRETGSVFDPAAAAATAAQLTVGRTVGPAARRPIEQSASWSLTRYPTLPRCPAGGEAHLWAAQSNAPRHYGCRVQLLGQ